MSVPSSSDSLVIVGGNTPKSLKKFMTGGNVKNTSEYLTKETKVEPSLSEIKSMHVVSNIRNRYARTVVTSKYANPDTSAQQATFSIVLPDTAFIAGFVMEINEKKYEAYVKEKEEAKQEYQAAVSSGRAAAHVAVSARDSNKFTVSVNVEPQSDVTFILTYEELLVRKHGKYEMVVNLHPGQLLDDLGVDIHINETRPVVHVEAPALRSGNEITDNVAKNEHATIIKDDDGMVHISFHPTVEQQKVIASEMAKASADKQDETETSEQVSSKYEGNWFSGQFVVEYDVERDPLGGEVLVNNDGYFVHFFAPTELKPIPKHILFVLDVSQSMEGRKIEQLKHAMKVILNELNSDDYFNLVKFSDEISVLNSNYIWTEIDIPAESTLPQSFKANSKNIELIRTIVDDFTDEASTNISDALIVSLRIISKGILQLNETENKQKPQPIIVFLTDGEATAGESRRDKILEIVKNRNDNRSAIFTLGFGDDADIEFLKELAIQNSGFLRIIYEDADASLQLQDFYKQISSPLLTNVNFKYSENVKEVTNSKFDILFHGSEFVVAGKVDDMVDGFVFVEGSTLDGVNKFSPTFHSLCQEEKKEYGNLERLWAYMTIKQLLDRKKENMLLLFLNATEMKTAANQIDETKNETVEEQALKLALKYSFVTPVTSLVVVKPDEPAAEGHLSHCLDDIVSCWNNDLVVLKATKETVKSLKYQSLRFKFSPRKKISCAFNTLEQGSSGIKELLRKKGNKIAQLFTKPKDGNQVKGIGLKGIQVNCDVLYNKAIIRDTRKYVNLDNKAQETTFTIVLPEESVFLNFDVDSHVRNMIAYGPDNNNKQAKKDYSYMDAVSKGQNALWLNVGNSNKITITINIMSSSEITFTLKYKIRPEMKNGKYEIVLNLDGDTCTNEIAANIFLKDTEPFKNIMTPILRNKYGTMENKYGTIIKLNDKETHIEFRPTIEEQAEIISALNGKDGNFSVQFIVEYEVEAVEED